MEKIGDNLCYTDTDSLIYLKAKDQPDPVADMRGDWLGMLTSEIPEGWRMTKFVSPAAKVYSYLLENESGEVRVVTKAKGVTLDHTAATTVNYDGMERIVRDYVENNSTSVLSAQSTIFKRTLGHIQSVDLTKNTSVVMDKLRFLPNFSTLSYGYSE
ncbi:unnamed protein product [Auanema sp. JU1783]|nr:unnamed protein product [Auanema sp. JU1783]